MAACLLMDRLARGLACLLMLCPTTRGQQEQWIGNHSFIFISGWPQSGTSLMQQMFSKSSDISTMVEGCERVLGTVGDKCNRWNHEGQWLLRAPSPLNSGAMCPIALSERNITEDAASIVGQWSKFWDLESVYLMEKSPQSILKIPYLRELLRSAKSVKFLIVVKHPVTLNIATPREQGWRYFNDPKVKSSNPYTPVKKREIKVVDMFRNIRHFDSFMTHDNSVNNSGNQGCSMGWLPAMELLVQQLRSSPSSVDDTRIVRYEQFIHGSKLCRRIFAWVFDSSQSDAYKRADREVCQAIFSNAGSTGSTGSTAEATRQKQRQRFNGGDNKGLGKGKGMKGGRRLHSASLSASHASSASSANLPVELATVATVATVASSSPASLSLSLSVSSNFTGQQRDLRLHSKDTNDKGGIGGIGGKGDTSSSFVFLPYLVSVTGTTRIVDFNNIFDKNIQNVKRIKLDSCPDRMCATAGKWYDAMHARLAKFGYSLKRFYTPSRNRNATLFSQWELI